MTMTTDGRKETDVMTAVVVAAMVNIVKTKLKGILTPYSLTSTTSSMTHQTKRRL